MTDISQLGLTDPGSAEQYAACIAETEKLIDEHNKTLEGDESTKLYTLDKKRFFTNLKITGGTTINRLSSLSWEDILELCSYNYSGVEPPAPRLLAKAIASVFRSYAKSSTSVTTGAGQIGWSGKALSKKDAQRASITELLTAYQPEGFADNPVTERLKELSRGQPCLVFSKDGKVNIEASANNLEAIRQGLGAVGHVYLEGQFFPTYLVGENPLKFLEENPFYPGRPLRPNGICPNTGYNMAQLSLPVRQFIWLAVKANKISSVQDKVVDLLDRLTEETQPMLFLQRRYPEIAKDFSTLEGLGRLPTLKVQLVSVMSKKTVLNGQKVQ